MGRWEGQSPGSGWGLAAVRVLHQPAPVQLRPCSDTSCQPRYHCVPDTRPLAGPGRGSAPPTPRAGPAPVSHPPSTLLRPCWACAGPVCLYRPPDPCSRPPSACAVAAQSPRRGLALLTCLLQGCFPFGSRGCCPAPRVVSASCLSFFFFFFFLK